MADQWKDAPIGGYLLRAKFICGNRVYIDNDTTILATVTQVCFESAETAKYEVSWFNNGTIVSIWLPEWRVFLANHIS